MNIDISFLKKDLIGTTIPKPLSGSLSGHAAGEPFDKHVYKKIKGRFPQNAFKQHEYLNFLYRNNLQKTSVVERYNLIKYPATKFLINRGIKTTKSWSLSNLFKEKQDDTADVLVVKDDFFNIIDVKTQNLDLKSQPPNIISAYKLAKMCKIMLENNDFDNHDIIYIGVSWKLENNKLQCKGVSIKELFKGTPQNLYINWAAALQIQFYVEKLDQNYKKAVKNWCIEYLQAFRKQASQRRKTMSKKFIKPFERF